MANPYTITLEFPEKTLIRGTKPTFQIIFRFTVNADGTDRTDQAFDYKIVPLKGGIGETRLEFNIDDLSVIPAEMDFSIGDGAGYLRNLAYNETAEGIATDKNFEVEILLDSSTVYLGNVIERTRDYIDKGLNSDGDNQGEFSFTCGPKTQALAKTSVFNRQRLPRDPLNYVTVTQDVTALAVSYDGDDAILTISHDSFGFVLAGGGTNIKLDGFSATERSISYLNDSFVAYGIDVNNSKIFCPASLEEDILLSITLGTITVIGVTAVYKNIRTLLEDIYGVVDASVVVDIKHNWIFNTGWTILAAVSNAVSASGTTTVTHTENTQVNAQDLDLQVDDYVAFALFTGNGMTDLKGEFQVTAVNSSTEFEIALDTAQTFSVGALVRKVTHDDIEDISILVEDLFTNENFYSGDNDLGISNLLDILKALSLDFFAFTGMLHNQKAFFKKLTYYDDGDLNTLGIVRSRTIKSMQDRYSYFENRVSTSLHSGEDKIFAYGDAQTIFPENIIQRQSFVISFQSRAVTDVSGEFTHDYSFSTMRNETPSPDWLVVGVRDPEVEALGFDDGIPVWKYKPNLWILPRLWYSLMGKNSQKRFEVIVADGVEYDFLKGFEYDGGRYNILGMTINWIGETTEFLALRLGDVTEETLTPLSVESFEAGTLGVYASTGSPETAEASTEQAYSGTYSAKLSESNPTIFSGIKTNVASETGKTYRMSARIYVASGSVSDVRIQENHTGQEASPTLTGQWELVTFDMVATGDVSPPVGVGYHCHVRNNAVAYFDDVTVVEVG